MCRKLTTAVLFALVLVPTAAARPTLVMPGVTYERVLQWTGAGPVELHVVTAPRPGGLYSLTPLLSNGTITGRETVSSMQRRASSTMTTIGVNGDFFNLQGGWPSGLLIRGSVIEHQPVYKRAAVGVDTSGNLHVGQVLWLARWRGPSTVWYPIAQLNGLPGANSTALFTPVWGDSTPAVQGTAVVLEPFPPALARNDLVGTITAVGDGASVPIPRDGAVLVARGTAAQYLRDEAVVGPRLTVRFPLVQEWGSVTDAISGGPTLVRDGKPVANAGEALTSAQLRGRDPRTAIGQRADGTVVMLAADGRRRGWSVGMTNWELALALMRYGCTIGFALDSGGSTTMAFDGQVLNRPSDAAGERPVADALVVGYTGVFIPAPAPTLSPNHDGVGDRETLSYKLVRPATLSAKLIAPDGNVRELDTGQKAPGRYRLSWDGTDAAGAPAPEGRYHWNVTATDDLGRASTDDHAFMLDNTLGFLQASAGARQITFTLTRDANIRVTIESTYGDILRTVAIGPRAAGPVTVRWNGLDGHRKRVRRGTYVVRVGAASPLGLSVLRRPLRISR
jgi:hypothetical protein